MALITVTSTTASHTGPAEDDYFVLNAISTSWPRRASARLDGGDGVDTLDLRSIFVGYGQMGIHDNTFVDSPNGVEGVFSVGDFDFRNFEIIYGNEREANSFLLQTVTADLTLYGGAGNDRFVGSFARSNIYYGGAGDDDCVLRVTDVAYGGTGDDRFDLYATNRDVTGAAYGGEGRETLELGFG